MRLGTFYQRIKGHTGAELKLPDEIYKIHIFIKHKPDAGIEAGWKIRFADVLTSTEALCEQLEQVLKGGSKGAGTGGG
jgi:hypothetical protein